MDKNKTYKLLYSPSRINLSDEDIKDRPHGVASANKDVIKEIRELKELINHSRNKIHKDDITENKSVAKLTKSKIQKQINLVKKIVKIGKMEKVLLSILSDRKPHSLKSLTKDIHTKDIKHLKKRLKQKIEGYGFIIKTYKAKGLETDSFYQLNYLPELVR